MTTIRQDFGVSSSVTGSTFIAGLECEIESIRNHGGIGGNWRIESDGSLRNEGMEFITAAPSSKAVLIEQFKQLHSSLKFTRADEAFSERTSIHVHVNCLDLQGTQVRSIIQFYALFEPLFFKMVEPGRANNIHCVALSNTVLPESYNKSISHLIRAWNKYTALNCKRMPEIGTLEFRHMHGHRDVELLTEWLNVIERVWTLGSGTEISQLDLQSKDAIMQYFLTIFAGTSVEKYAPHLFTLIENSLVDLKLSFN